MDVGKFNGCRLYTELRSDYRLRLWAPMSTSCFISAVAEFLLFIVIIIISLPICVITSVIFVLIYFLVLVLVLVFVNENHTGNNVCCVCIYVTF